jgi:DNA-binding protein WhiA
VSLFCEKTKAELKSVKLFSRRQKLAALSAFIRALGTIELSCGGKRLVLRLDGSICKNAVTELIDGLYKDSAVFYTERSFLYIEGAFLERLLRDAKIFKQTRDGVNEFVRGIDGGFISDAAARLAYIRGLFLGAGAVTIASGYHLEFSLASEALASDLQKLLYQIIESPASCAKTVKRKDKTIVYLKDGEAVCDLLAALGAAGAVLEINNVHASRAAEQLTNRRLNCDIANIDKTVSVSQRQTVAITVLKHNGKFDGLSGPLKEAAFVRLANPEASLEEMAGILSISKSGLRHRLEKIVGIAENDE